MDDETEVDVTDAPKPRAPIDQREPSGKARLSSLPKPTRPTPGMFPDLFTAHQEKMNVTSIGKQMYSDFVMAQTLACGDLNEIADAEQSIIEAHNSSIAAGTTNGQIKMVDGRPRAIPTRLEELADLAERRLDAALTKHGFRMIAHAGFLESIEKKMDDALVHADTSRDHTLMGQIRAHMQKLPKAKAKSFAMEMAMKGERAAIHTVFGSPPFLLGLDEKDLSEIRQIAHRSVTPELANQQELGEKMRKSLATAKNAIEDKQQRLSIYRVESERTANEALNRLRKG